MDRRREPQEDPMSNPIPEEDWRCRKCATLLGVRRAGRVHVKHKRAQLVLRGHVMAVCPRCAELNETETASEDARPAA
jgi:phage FluMu protein Com